MAKKLRLWKELQSLLPEPTRGQLNALKNSIEEHGVRYPVLHLADGRIIDGWHRWTITNGKAPTEEISADSDEEAKAIGLALNLARRSLSPDQVRELHATLRKDSELQRKTALKLRDQGLTQEQTACKIGVPRETIRNWESGDATIGHLANGCIPEVMDCRITIPKSSKDEIYKRSKRGEGQESIASDYGVTRQAIGKIVGKIRARLKGAEKEDDFDRRVFKELGITIQPYDVWHFTACDPNFGKEYPGRIPGQLVAHCLYFWTRRGDVVLDPMAGGCTTLDVCKKFQRKCIAFDINPQRKSVGRYDMLKKGWPTGTSGVDFIFWDPPYYKKVDKLYGDASISRLSRRSYLSFFQRSAETIPKSFKGRLALLVSDYNDEDGSDDIWYWDYVNLFLSTNRWEVERRIQVPLSTQSVHPDIVNKFRKARKLARLNRDLVVFRAK